ncbi:MAG: DUF6537 domain-containing protein, partial [Pseudomonadota bacterium]
DCSAQSNCIAIEPTETEFGRKRRINQSACNKDFSCLKGFCPSFVTVRGGKLKKRAPAERPDLSAIPSPALPDLSRPWNIAVTGVGGTGVLTIGALIGMAAHLENKNPLIMDMAGLAQKGGAVLSHIRIAAPDQSVRSPRIANGGADVLIAADSVVAASKDGITLCDNGRTKTVLNAKVTPVSDFIRARDFDFKAAAVERTVEKASGSKEHFHNFSEIALAVAGDEIAANVMMLGYAWQNGLVPVGLEALETAIQMNGVAVQANLDAFAWGRILAHDPETVRANISLETAVKPQEQLSLDDLIAHRVKHLTAYQNASLAKRYTDLLDRVAAAVDGSPRADEIKMTVARNYAKLLSYKDEYEVARLFCAPAFREALEEQFEGDYRIALNLAPPMLPGKAPNGRPRKREFGPWMLRAFKLLTHMKGLRGTALDIFGHTAERRHERAMISDYEADIDLALNTNADAGVILALLTAPDAVRGFGPVKEEAMAAYRERRAELRAALTKKTAADIAAE